MAYPVTANTPRAYTSDVGPFGNNDIFVVAFTAPALGAEVTPGSTMQMAYVGGFDHNRRLATLATEPCVVATSATVGGKIRASVVGSQQPSFSMALIGTAPTYPIKLAPGETLYVNFVNRLDYNGTPSCTTSDCRAFVDFIN